MTTYIPDRDAEIMQIKTIRFRLDNGNDFDATVNSHIRDGWTLKKRYIIPSQHDGVHAMLIAELVRNEPERPSRVREESLNIDVSLDMDEAKAQMKELLDLTHEVSIKYFVDGLEPIQSVEGGDWIDLRAAEDVTLASGEYKLIRLGVGMILPEGYEALVVPRSSTYKNFGIIQANGVGVIDNSYSGDADEWHFPAIALRDTVIQKNDRICQFRIIRNQPGIALTRVSSLNEVSRGGIGSTGRR